MSDKTYYFIDSGIDPDSIFGCEYPVCLDRAEVVRLCCIWNTNLFNVMHEASDREIEQYGVYDSYETGFTKIFNGLISHDELNSVANDYIDRYYPDAPSSFTGAALISEIMKDGNGDMMNSHIARTWFDVSSKYAHFCGRIYEYDLQTYNEDGEISGYALIGFDIC